MPEEEIPSTDNSQLPPAPAAENNDNGQGEQKTKSKKVKKVKPTDPPPPKIKKEPNRFTKTAVFYKNEFGYIDEIVSQRKEIGITRDWNHFIRQCVDFTINYKKVDPELKNLRFSVPDRPPLFLKDAFYQGNKSNENE